MHIQLTLNGRPVEWEVEPGEILLDVLRRKGLYSIKQGCLEGDCGACTVLVDGKAMRSCLLLVAQVADREVTTLEALGTPTALHPLQQTFWEEGAVQCGFCTPGMILSAKALLDQAPHPSEQDVKQALDGNLCRCTGYKKIVQAVLKASERMRS